MHSFKAATASSIGLLTNIKKNLMDNSIIGIGIAIGLSFFFLYTRKKKWAKPGVRWLICSALFAIGLVGLKSTPISNKDNIMLFWGLCVPIAYYSLDRLFRHLSFKIYDRDFILWLRWSDEIDNSLFGKNPHVKAYDRLFSIGLLIFIAMMTVLGTILSHE